MSAGDRLPPQRDQLAALSYGLGALELIRFRPDPVDDAAAGVVRSVTAGGDLACADFRGGLDAPGVETLRLFASRRVLHARRTSSVAALYESLDAFALLPRLEDVPWDSWVRANLFVARSIGGDPGSIRDRFADVAGERAAHRFDVALESMDRVEDLAQCRIAEVRTTYGIGFVETLIVRGRTTWNSFSSPRQADHRVDYRPTSNLAQLAAGLADAVDASGHGSAGPIGHDQLAATSFALSVPGSFVETTGCLSFVAEPTGEDPAVTVFLAELPEFDDAGGLAEPTEVDDAAALAGLARDHDDQAAVADGRRLVLLSPQPRFDDGDDAPADLGELVELATRALADPATR